MDGVWVGLLLVLVGFRLASARRFWRLPTKQGPDWFFTAEVGRDFYAGPGAALARRYRLWLAAPFAVDAVAVGLLAAADRLEYALHEQFAAMVLTAVFYNLLVANFAVRAKALAPAAETRPPTAVYLSLEPRRLRDHTVWAVEALVLGLTAASLALVAAAPREDARGAALEVVWLLYIQAGLVLLKQVFVRWRVKLPARRTEEYARWRAAWLAYHLRVFDAVRVIMAVALFHLSTSVAGVDPPLPVALVVWVLLVAAYLAYCVRERRRLAVVEREVEPLTLAREFPASPVAEGRYVAGGLFFFNADNPAVLARGPAGVALNLANARTYLWAAYLSGLVLLVVRQAVA
jgi:hypothetical protein